MAIRRFENAMYDQVARGPNPNLEPWQQVFASVKNRLLHGAKDSSVVGGETKEEITIMGHVKVFIERFKNTGFVGFGANGSQNGSPAPQPQMYQQQHQTQQITGSGQGSTIHQPVQVGKEEVDAIPQEPIGDQDVSQKQDKIPVQVQDSKELDSSGEKEGMDTT
jgi:hypothetical protein